MQRYAPPEDPCKSNPDCIDVGGKVPLLKNIRTGLIDKDTPKSAMTKKAADGKLLKLMVNNLSVGPQFILTVNLVFRRVQHQRSNFLSRRRSLFHGR